MKTSTSLRSRLGCIAFAIAFMAVQPAFAATIVLLDDMSSPSYSSFSFNSSSNPSTPNPDDVSFEDSFGVGSGGNPGEFLQVLHHHEVDRDMLGEPIGGDGSVDLQSFFENTSAIYNPLTDGTITDISFSIDVRFDALGIEGGSIGSLFFTVNDSGGGNAAGFSSVALQAGWQTITVSGLTNANFVSRDFAGALDLTFGFGFSSSGDVFFGDETLEIDVDNFTVTVNSVPEPAGLAVMGLVALATLRQRRRLR